MRERLHQKGESYLRNVESWITDHTLLGLEAELFGDAYDPTNIATRIGETFFDFSLKLKSGTEVKKIAYAECKYREESSGNTNAELKAFLQNVYSALLHATSDEAKHAEFFFISTIPPDEWRRFLNKKRQFLENHLKLNYSDVDLDIVYQMQSCVHILVLSERVISKG